MPDCIYNPLSHQVQYNTHANILVSLRYMNVCDLFKYTLLGRAAPALIHVCTMHCTETETDVVMLRHRNVVPVKHAVLHWYHIPILYYSLF